MSSCNPCGEFNEGTKQGQCAPRRLKRSCEAPRPYTNEEQSVTLECPEGSITDPVTYTVEAGTITSVFSVEDANETALELAQAGAEALREASPCMYVNTEQTYEDVCP